MEMKLPQPHKETFAEKCGYRLIGEDDILKIRRDLFEIFNGARP